MKIAEISQLAAQHGKDLHHIHNGNIWKVDTGFPDLDRSTGGFRESDFIVIAARPATGKSSFARNLAYNIATLDESGRSYLFFSSNFSCDELCSRLFSDLSGIETWKICRNSLKQPDFLKIDQIIKNLKATPLYIDDTTHLTLADLATRIHEIDNQFALGGVVIDDISMLLPYNQTANYESQLDIATHGLRDLARELKIPIIIMANLPHYDDDNNPRPSLADLKSYGSLEKDASIVIFLHRPNYSTPEIINDQNELDEISRNITDLIIAKNTHGPITTTEVYFHPDKLKFIPIEDSEL